MKNFDLSVSERKYFSRVKKCLYSSIDQNLIIVLL